MPAETENGIPDALPAAYAATVQLATNESQLIWQRAGNFLLFNTLLAAILVATVQVGNRTIGVLQVGQAVAAVGVLYGFIHYLSMSRAWGYHDAYMDLMALQEKALGLANFGAALQIPGFLQARRQSALQKLVDKGDFRLNARIFEGYTTLLFVAFYLVFAVWTFFQIRTVSH